MENIKALIDQLKTAGITPQVDLTISMDQADIDGIKNLQARLQQSGIASEVHITIHTGSEPAPGPEPDITGEKSITVSVSEDKLSCLTFTNQDKAGKPIMVPREPRVRLVRGTRLLVSAEHKVSDKDPGDGTIIATGGDKFFFILDCQSNPEARGLFVRQSDVTSA
jgi:hypothetical protein